MELACFLTAHYDFNLDKEMIIKAILHDYLPWLNYVWAFKKNYFNNKKEKKVYLVELF